MKNEHKIPAGLINVREAAEMLGIVERTVYSWVKRGVLSTAPSLTGRVRFHRDDIKWLADKLNGRVNR